MGLFLLTPRFFIHSLQPIVEPILHLQKVDSDDLYT